MKMPNPVGIPFPRRALQLIAALVVLSFASAHGAFNSYLQLEINGEDVEGEPDADDVGGVDVSTFIECYSVEQEVYTNTDSSDPRDPGRAVAGAFKFVKRIDKATPALLSAIGTGTAVDATFLFFRRDENSGEAFHYHTVTLTNARIVSVRRWTPNTLDPAAAAFPDLEEVQIIFATMTVTDEKSGESGNFSTTSQQ